MNSENNKEKKELFSIHSYLKQVDPNISQEKIKKIVANYTDDYDIIELDIHIQRILSQNEKQEKHKSEKYRAATRAFVESYRKLMAHPQIISFGATVKKKESLTLEQIEERHTIISDYLKVASEFYPLDIRREFPLSVTCPVCDSSLDDVFVDENGFQCCPECNYEKIMSTSYSNSAMNMVIPTSNGAGNTNVANKKDCEDRKNFWASLMKYQCKQTTRFPQTELFQALDIHFKNKGFPYTRDDIKTQQLHKNGTRGITTRNMLLTALNETGYSDYYVDCSLIGQLYWDWKAPDVSHLEDAIMELYDLTRSAHFINIQFRLYKILVIVGHDCSSSDFKLTRTTEILENLELRWKEICEHSGLPYIASL